MLIEYKRKAATQSNEVKFALRVERGSSNLRLNDVKTAFGLGKTGPSTRARIFPGTYGTRAMSATYARVTAVVQNVIRRLVRADVVPDLIGIPVSDGIDFHQPEFFIPLDFAGVSASGCLIAADAGDPGLQLA
jgi:hypothetical protein